MDPEEATEDRRRRERIRANAALFGLPLLTPSEIRQGLLDARRAWVDLIVEWRSFERSRLIGYLALMAVLSASLVAAGIFLAGGESHLAGLALLAWVLLCVVVSVASITRSVRQQRRSRTQ